MGVRKSTGWARTSRKLQRTFPRWRNPARSIPEQYSTPNRSPMVIARSHHVFNARIHSKKSQTLACSPRLRRELFVAHSLRYPVALCHLLPSTDQVAGRNRRQTFMKTAKRLGSKGQWSEVMSLFAELAATDIPLNVQVFNAAISSVAKSGRSSTVEVE